jgi:hypothetical protein
LMMLVAVAERGMQQPANSLARSHRAGGGGQSRLLFARPRSSPRQSDLNLGSGQ